MDAALIHKAKYIAKIKGTSVSRLFGEFIIEQENDDRDLDYPAVTLSILSVMKQQTCKFREFDYLRLKIALASLRSAKQSVHKKVMQKTVKAPRM